MRDTMKDKQISSYFLKTVVLWEVQQYSSSFWINNSLSYIFMHVSTISTEAHNYKIYFNTYYKLNQYIL